MAARLFHATTRISCIRRVNLSPREEGVESVGGLHSDGTEWKLSQYDAISLIEGGRYKFYVDVDGSCIDVLVGLHKGHKFLKTMADTEQVCSLLSLPDCPR